MKDILKKIQIPSSFIFGYLGIIVAAFIPIAILLLENGVETRIDRLIIINDLLNFELFFGVFFTLTLLAVVKISIEKKKSLIARIFDLLSLALSLLLLVCSFLIYKNTISWLNDVSTSLATDTSYTSNPMLDSSLPIDRGSFLAIRPNDTSSYKKNARLSYIKNAKSTKEQELRWELLLNDADTYRYEGKNDFWVYIREYYLFLNSILDKDKDIALRGFENISAHVKDIGMSVDDRTDCSYVASTLLQLKFEKTDWRSELWAGLVGRYMTVALIDTDIHKDTRTCWLGSLPEYLTDKNLDVGDDGHLELLADALWNAFNSFEVQNSEYRAAFYSDVPQYIIDFYATLSSTTNSEDYFRYIKNL